MANGLERDIDAKHNERRRLVEELESIEVGEPAKFETLRDEFSMRAFESTCVLLDEQRKGSSCAPANVKEDAEEMLYMRPPFE